MSVYHVVPSSVDCLLDVGRGCAYCLTGYITTCFFTANATHVGCYDFYAFPSQRDGNKRDW